MTIKITNESWEIKSALKELYDELVKTEKLFSTDMELFTAGLVYGLLHNKKHDIEPTASFIKLFVIQNEMVKDIIDVVFAVLNDGRDHREIWNEMLHIADGGIIELNQIYKSNKNFRIPHLVEDAKKIWPKRVNDLYNINLDVSK